MAIPFKIIPAYVIYNVNTIAKPKATIRKYLSDYRILAQDTTRDYEDRIQAWQFVKAYTQILKDREEWLARKEGKNEG